MLSPDQVASQGPGGFLNLNGGATDPYYAQADGSAYPTVAAACNAVPIPARRNRTVNVAGDEYWWKEADLSNGGLVLKFAAGGPAYNDAELRSRIEEAEQDINQLEQDTTRIDNEVDTIQALIPPTATPSNRLATLGDIPTQPTGPGGAILYDSTGQATDGAMTQRATTQALEGKSDVGHTHSYNELTDKPTIPAGYDDTDIRNLLNNKTNNATTAALSARVQQLETTVADHEQRIQDLENAQAYLPGPIDWDITWQAGKLTYDLIPGTTAVFDIEADVNEDLRLRRGDFTLNKTLTTPTITFSARVAAEMSAGDHIWMTLWNGAAGSVVTPPATGNDYVEDGYVEDDYVS